jgi:hypothetical protein
MNTVEPAPVIIILMIAHISRKLPDGSSYVVIIVCHHML